MKIKISKSQWEEMGRKAGWVEESVPCKVCGEETKMIGNKLCDRCWMVKGYIENPVNDSDKAHVYKMTMRTEPQIIEKINEIVKAENGKVLGHPLHDKETMEEMYQMSEFVKKNGIEALRNIMKEVEQKAQK